MERSAGLRKIARLDCAGGGQVVVDGQFASIGHMDPGVGTSMADVSDPLAPRIVAQVPVAAGFHSHKVRASNGLMLVNRELVNKAAAQEGFAAGWAYTTYPSRPSPAKSPIGVAAAEACIVSRSTVDTPICRRSWTAISATS